jgi:hypothetical protein
MPGVFNAGRRQVNPAEGTVTLERGAVTYTGQWATTGDRIIVYLGLEQESARLGMFATEPEALARMLLAELIDRQLAKYRIPPK